MNFENKILTSYSISLANLEKIDGIAKEKGFKRSTIIRKLLKLSFNKCSVVPSIKALKYQSKLRSKWVIVQISLSSRQ